MPSTDERRQALQAVFREARGCTRCPQLAATRTQVVLGAGDVDADLMFVGEAPGREEDERGVPFVGRSGMLLDELLAGIGIAREDVFVTNALQCRPPDNRNPAPSELTNCETWLWRQLELVRPVVVCTLGNFATKLLRGDLTPITKIHGQAEVRTLGPLTVRLLPLFHPAAALYQRSNIEALRRDVAQIPGLLALGPPPQDAVEPDAEPEVVPPEVVGHVVADTEAPHDDAEERSPAPLPEPPASAPEPPPGQLELF